MAYKKKYKKRGRRPKFITIYEIKSLKTNRIYIGSSKDSFIRWNSHLYKLITNTHNSKDLLSEFKLYGISNFTFRILELLEYKDYSTYKLRKLEQVYINKYSIDFLFNSIKAFKSSPPL